MAARLLASCGTLTILLVFSVAFAQDTTDTDKKFPDKFFDTFYSTEVQTSFPGELATSYAKEYYDSVDKRGALKIYFQGQDHSFFYDDSQVIDVDSENCTAVDTDTSPYFFNAINKGWLNKNPLIIGPSALLWYGVDNKDKAVYKQIENVRDIECDKFEIKIKNAEDDLTLQYYFAPTTWTTPYQYQKLPVPIRVRISGKSSSYSADNKVVDVDEYNDFAYFRPDIGDFKNLEPPTGIGCEGKTAVDADEMPDVPKVFQYSAEMVDLIQVAKHEDVEIQFQRTWYDYASLMARRDVYSKKKGFTMNLYDFNTGAMYSTSYPGSCEIKSLKDTHFYTLDEKKVTGHMKTEEEALDLDGEFYSLGKTNIRGIPCDVYESVEFDGHYEGTLYYKLVVTVYFTKTNINVAVKSESETRIPVFYTITGWEAPGKKALHRQYNIFEFNDIIAPPMYDSYRLDRCYEKPESKAYFVVIMDVGATTAAQMEEQDDFIITKLRELIAIHARIPQMRIPFLKADYKSTGVFVTGVMLDRPPAMIQFYEGFTGIVKTHDKHIRTKASAKTVQDCASACIDDDEICKGFYWCGQACFLTSNDLMAEGDKDTRTLGECTSYIRTVEDSSDYQNAYLDEALGYLETAVLNKTIELAFRIPNGETVLSIQNIIIGEGPYTGVDAGDKPFAINVEWRKLDKGDETTSAVEYAGSLHDCYKRCKEAGSLCSSFSFCPDSPKDNKECLISSKLVVKGDTRDTELIADKFCNIYNLRFSDFFVAYPERMSVLDGDKVINGMSSLEKCAEQCRREKGFTCRGFEFCRSLKTCTLHRQHILQLKPGLKPDKSGGSGKECIHYAARYIADYMDLGRTLVDDSFNKRVELSLEECAQYCSEDQGENCKSFNYCPAEDFTQSSCEVSTRLLREDGIATTVKKGCRHYEKRDEVHDWDSKKRAAKELSKTGYTAKGFTGLVVGMLALGLVIGAGAFVLYSYIRSRNSGEGMAVRFMKNES